MEIKVSKSSITGLGDLDIHTNTALLLHKFTDETWISILSLTHADLVALRDQAQAVIDAAEHETADIQRREEAEARG